MTAGFYLHHVMTISVSEQDRYCILYEETDESTVFELSINVPATRAEHVELMRYPRTGERFVSAIVPLLIWVPVTGTNNPTWALKLLAINLLETSDENFESVKVSVLFPTGRRWCIPVST